jgi:hypothetical protein
MDQERQRQQRQQQQLPPLSSLIISNNNNNNLILHSYIPPSSSAILEAIGEPIPSMFLPGNCFNPLPNPGPNDWLSQNQQDLAGQTYQAFVDSNADAPYVVSTSIAFIICV